MGAASDERPFKVVIVGGGFAGLSLAIMLEKFDIDYVLLEARGEIAPAIGAGIAVCPNGCRILDQIGCYEPLKALGLAHYHTHRVQGYDGRQHLVCRDGYEHYEKRFGYPVLFVDRPSLVRLLHNKIQKKENIQLNQRVADIELKKDGVRVHSKDGQIFEGSIVVGADGIYSAVRETMYRIAKEVQPGYFAENPSSKVPCYYFATYGIAKDVPNLSLEEVYISQGKGFSYFVFPGHNGQVFFLLDEKYSKTPYGDDIQRRFSAEEEAAFIKKYSNTRIADKVRFQDLYDHRVVGGMTPLHHTVYDKWSFKRIITMGDSAHKPNPGTGMGANLAFESAAELVNGILNVKKERAQGLNGLEDSDIKKIMDYVESSRIGRAKKVVDESYENQVVNGTENSLKTWFALRVLPNFVKESFLIDAQCGLMGEAPSLHYLPKPQRPHVVPFKDELPARPFSQIAAWAGWAAFGGAMGVTIYLAKKSMRLDVSNRTLWANAIPIIRPWASSKGVGSLLRMLTSVFSDVVASENLATRVQAIHFLSQLIGSILVWTVEGNRAANKMNILSLPALFLTLIQLRGIGYIAPYWALLHASLSDTATHYRYVKPDVVKSLVPALTLGYVVPSVLMMTPTNVSAWQDWTALWQFAPPMVPILATVFSAGLRWWRNLGRNKTEEEKKQEAKEERLAIYNDDDVAGLKSAYSYATLIQATSHLVTMAYIYTHPDLSFGKIFCGLPNPFEKNWNLPDRATEVGLFFKYDMLLSMSALAAHGLYSIWQLRRDGYVRTQDAVKAAIATVFGNIIVGPGATLTSLWSWRESAISGLIRK
ncbi:unnamed protein product [Clonostachys rosea]|uniref:FAD-binding domain-containing protein n=1 Tax=Bionectria ochroleuca TaxID=29856 RepID=A0ABY6TRR3_BIOOC|nr:unnamed protein product [Clonostachys rosea]